MPYEIIKFDDAEEGGAPKGTWKDDLLDWTANFKERRGTASARCTIDDADTKFIEYRFDCGATSGDNRGIYNRLYLTGAGSGGESLRTYTDIVGVACTTAHGAHISLGFGESTVKGSITGLGVAMRATLGLPNGAMASGGTYAAIQAEIYSFGSGADAGAVTELSFIRFVNGGHADGIADVDDDVFLFVIDGGAEDDAHLQAAAVAETEYAYNIRIKVHGVTMYLMCASARA